MQSIRSALGLVIMIAFARSSFAERYTPSVDQRFSYAAHLTWDYGKRSWEFLTNWDCRISLFFIDYRVLEVDDDKLVLQYTTAPVNPPGRTRDTAQTTIDGEVRSLKKQIESQKTLRESRSKRSTGNSLFDKILSAPSPIERGFEKQLEHLYQASAFTPLFFPTSGIITIQKSDGSIEASPKQTLPFALGDLATLPLMPLPPDGNDAVIDRRDRVHRRVDSAGKRLGSAITNGTRSLQRGSTTLVAQENWHENADQMSYFKYAADHRVLSGNNSKVSFYDRGTFVFNPTLSMPEAGSYTSTSKGLSFTGMSGTVKTEVKFRRFDQGERWLVKSGVFPQADPLAEEVFPEIPAKGRTAIESMDDRKNNKALSQLSSAVHRFAPPSFDDPIFTKVLERATSARLETTMIPIKFEPRDPCSRTPLKKTAKSYTTFELQELVAEASLSIRREVDFGTSLSQRILLNWVSRQRLAKGVVRTWKDTSGQFGFRGSLVGRVGDDAVLESPEGRRKRVPIARLDESSRFVAEHYGLTAEVENTVREMLADPLPPRDPGIAPPIR
ncbi:MAG: hypothetical protein AAF664_18165 [Planctomycetota bacterium]